MTRGWTQGWRWLMVALVLTGCAQPAPRVHKIGLLNRHSQLTPALAGFKRGAEERGLVNVEYIYNGEIWAQPEGLEQSVRQMTDEGVDLVFAVGTRCSQAAQTALSGTDVPLIFAAVDDPEGIGLIETRSRPGKNTTGVTYFGLHEVPRLKWFLAVLPERPRLYMPCNSENPGTAISLPLVREAAKKLEVELVSVEVRTMDDVDRAIAAIPEDVDGIFLPPDTLIASRIAAWAQAAIAHKLPLSVGNELGVQYGALMSYGFSFYEAGRRAARLADQVLRGEAQAGDLPIEVPEFYLSVNLRTAEAIGVTVPDDMLRQARDIIR